MKYAFTFLACGLTLAVVQPLTAQSSAPPVPNVSWGATRSGNVWTSWAPHDTGAAWADPALAAGSDRLLTADEPDFNLFYNPQHGDDQFGNYGEGLGGWMGAALPNNGSGFQITQPQALVDPTCPDGVGNQRECYLLIARALRQSDHASYLIIGNTHWTGPQESNAWTFHSLNAASYGDAAQDTYVDGLWVGQTSSAVILSVNLHAWSDRSFKTALVLVIPKVDLYPATAGQPQPVSWWTNFSNADQSPAFALVPAVSYSASPVGYLVNAYDPGKDTARQLTIWTVDGTNLLAPVLQSQTLPVAAFSVPPNAAQVGTDVQINTWDAEITNVVLPQRNALWVAQATGCTPDGDTAQRSCVRWYHIDPVAGRLLQQGTLGYPGAHFYDPAIGANPNGDMTLAFSGSATYAAVGVYYSGRRASDPPNTLASFALLHDGDGCYVRLDHGLNMVGHRNAVALDLADHQSMWIMGAFASGTNSRCESNGWGTWLGRVTW